MKSSVFKKKIIKQNVTKNLKEKIKPVDNDYPKGKRDFLKNYKIPKHVQSNGSIGNFMVMDQNNIVNLHHELVPPLKKKAKKECPHNLNGISHDDIIKFFREDETLKEYWQKIMDTDKHESNFYRHVNCLTSRKNSYKYEQTNPCFLAPSSSNIYDTVDMILSRIVRKFVSEHPKIGKEETGIQENYAQYCLIPEGKERYLIQKFNMIEDDAKFWYKNHFAYRCDYCDWIYNEEHEFAKHYKDIHQESHKLTEIIRDILKVANIKTITRKQVRAQLKKGIASEMSKDEINVIIEQVMDEIQKENSQRDLREVENCEDQEDNIPDFDNLS